MATTATVAPHFRTQRPGDLRSTAAQHVREAHWSLFSVYAEPGASVEDFHLEAEQIKVATGWSKGFVENAIFAHARLQQLPMLRALQAETHLLDMSHLSAIDSALDELGPDIEPEIFAEFDELLTGIFTPTRVDQQIPHRTLVTRRMRELIKRIDPARAYDPKKRKARSQDTADSVNFETFSNAGVVKGVMELVTDTVTAYRIRQHLLATAREHSIQMVEAAVKLLTGEIEPSTKPTLNIFAPRDRQAGDPAYIPGFGWTGPEDTLALDDWLEKISPKVLDLDEAASVTTNSYTPTAGMRAFATARDGTCIFPGCTRPAERCQLDHRVPFDEGGPTTALNLFSLCQHHHNMKTDKRAFYVHDPNTNTIIWLFADGTYELSACEGILFDELTPTSPRWRSSLESISRTKAIAAEFYAKGHKILDDFDKDKDLETAERRIEALEQEYGMEFPIKATLPDPGPPPVEPDHREPPFPDPLECGFEYSPVERHLVALLAAA